MISCIDSKDTSSTWFAEITSPSKSVTRAMLVSHRKTADIPRAEERDGDTVLYMFVLFLTQARAVTRLSPSSHARLMASSKIDRSSLWTCLHQPLP
ncbi:hypothetical protein KCU89_g125, partial [Aureobasidium melanogenum]